MLATLAQNTQTANPIGSLLFIVPLGLIFYFMLIRPQSQRRKAQMQLQAELDVGDEIVTTAGIYGTITEIDDDYGIVSLEIAPGTEIRIARAAVATRLMDDDELEDEDEVEGAEPGS
jgi:preprotein translocase subunit YajC